MSLDHLDPDLVRTFLAIVETRSFSRAAERIGRTPSAVSMQVKRLEELAGRELFVREARSVAPTAHAESVVHDARRLLQRSEALMQRLRAPALEGRIAIGIPDDYASVFMPPILARFAHSHPVLQVEVMCEDSRELIAHLRDGRLDATLATATEITERSGLMIDAVHEEPIVWLGARGGEAHRRRPMPLAAAQVDCSWRKQAETALAKAGIESFTAYTSPLSAGQLAAVAADLAIAPLPACLVGGAIERVPESAGLPDLPRSTMVFARRDDEDARVRALGGQIAEFFGAQTRERLLAA